MKKCRFGVQKGVLIAYNNFISIHLSIKSQWHTSIQTTASILPQTHLLSLPLPVPGPSPWLGPSAREATNQLPGVRGRVTLNGSTGSGRVTVATEEPVRWGVVDDLLTCGLLLKSSLRTPEELSYIANHNIEESTHKPRTTVQAFGQPQRKVRLSRPSGRTRFKKKCCTNHGINFSSK